MDAPVVAVVGGGQLARMMAGPAAALGIELRVLAESPSASAAQVVRDAPVGMPADDGVLARLVAHPSPASVLTFEHEHVPGAVLREIAAGGTPVHPGPDALLHAQDKIEMRSRLGALGAPVPRWAAVASPAELDAFLAEVDGRAVVKTARGGYDGKGVRVVDDARDVEDWFAAAAEGGPRLLAEELVPFVRELAVLAARSPSGEVRTWPVVESLQVEGVCFLVTAPAPDLDAATERAAREIAVQIAEGLDVTGVLAVEMFEVRDVEQRDVEVSGARVSGARLSGAEVSGIEKRDPTASSAEGAVPSSAEGGAPSSAGKVSSRILVNELAMRPHNSGHWTIDGATTSQFEQHLRAVLDLPLGDTSARAPWTVMANVLGSARERLADGVAEVAALDPGAKVHVYGKEVRPGRKLGHVTVSGADLDEVRARAEAAAAALRGDNSGPIYWGGSNE